MSVNTSNNAIQPELVDKVKWEYEYDSLCLQDGPLRSKWSGKTVTFPIRYGGGRTHDFKAYIFKKTTDGNREYRIYLEDQTKDDHCEAVQNKKITIDLSAYAENGIKFKILNVLKPEGFFKEEKESVLHFGDVVYEEPYVLGIL